MKVVRCTSSSKSMAASSINHENFRFFKVVRGLTSMTWQCMTTLVLAVLVLWTTTPPSSSGVTVVEAIDFRAFWTRRIVPFFFDRRNKLNRQLLMWNHVDAAPPDAILGIAQAYRECADDRKVNICVGAYRDQDGLPWVLPSVQAAEEHLLLLQSKNDNNKEYLPIEGDVEFLALALEFAYGEKLKKDLATRSRRLASVQTLSGTGACCVGGHFLAKFLKARADLLEKEEEEDDNDNVENQKNAADSSKTTPRIYLPSPTWSNHWNVFRQCGLEPHAYRYYNHETNSLDMAGLLQDLESAPRGSAVLLHACAHNPTGCDPTRWQWRQIAQRMQERNMVAFFDSAYQGFASGNAHVDAAAFRTFVSRYSQTIPILLAQSFAKNFGLYGERSGTLSIVCRTEQEQEHVLSQLRSIIRPIYSSPPRHGSSIVKTILSNSTLREQYQKECASMAHRIQSIRQQLIQALHEAGSTLDWSHMDAKHQTGMFAYTSNLTPERCDALTQDYAIYLTRNGRISLAGLHEKNLAYVAQAIHKVTSPPSSPTPPPTTTTPIPTTTPENDDGSDDTTSVVPATSADTTTDDSEYIDLATTETSTATAFGTEGEENQE
ncbi:hypothetical protein ACA910_000504 [Epithemia clementina (nom. ined.)]